jgi:hypothetical protein
MEGFQIIHTGVACGLKAIIDEALTATERR